MTASADMPHIIITGTTKGLGFHLCCQYLDLGYHVTGFARSPAPSDLEKYQSDRRYTHIRADLSKLANVDLLLAEAKNRRTSILIINAADYSSLENKNQAALDEQLNLNLFFPISLIDKIRSQMPGSGPKIVFISSVMAQLYDIKNPAYGSAKKAVSIFLAAPLAITGNERIPFLNVISGPIYDGKKDLSITSKIVSTPYYKAAQLIIHAANTNRENIFVPKIWCLILLLVPIFGKKNLSIMLNKFR